MIAIEQPSIDITLVVAPFSAQHRVDDGALDVYVNVKFEDALGDTEKPAPSSRSSTDIEREL